MEWYLWFLFAFLFILCIPLMVMSSGACSTSSGITAVGCCASEGSDACCTGSDDLCGSGSWS